MCPVEPDPVAGLAPAWPPSAAPAASAARSRRRVLWHAGLIAGGAVLAALAPVSTLAQIKSGDNPDASPNWLKIRASLFGERQIAAAEAGVLQLETPVRAEDAAVVPVGVRTRLPVGGEHHLQKLWLIIDNNPSPVAAVFDFTPQSGRADLETRVRIDEYTHVRAVAQLSDGRLMMATNFVKASGGCSAPPGKDQAAAMASLGRMKLRVEGDVAANQPVQAQLMVSHPNNSGLAMDQLTRQYTPAHYVRTIDVRYAGEPVLKADLDISISENPNLRFYFVPRTAGELTAHIVDSKDLSFDGGLKIQPAAL